MIWIINPICLHILIFFNYYKLHIISSLFLIHGILQNWNFLLRGAIYTA